MKELCASMAGLVCMLGFALKFVPWRVAREQCSHGTQVQTFLQDSQPLWHRESETQSARVFWLDLSCPMFSSLSRMEVITKKIPVKLHLAMSRRERRRPHFGRPIP